MKAFLVLFLFVSTLAHAVEVKVSETPTDFWRPNVRANFAVNQEAGRAWVEVEMYDRAHGQNGNGSVSTRVKVEGLAFDQASSSITFTHEGQVFECATVSRRWYGTKISPTGCDLKMRKVKLTVDDGYNTYRREFVQVHLVTK